jgi:TetR/AcrR family transcriptional repressor of mexJK operon
MVDSQLPRMFWEAGPQRIQDAFADLLRWRMSAGELEIDDVPRASSQFFTLLKGEPHAQLVFGCGGFCNGDIQDHLVSSVDLFLRAYAVRDGNDVAGR